MRLATFNKATLTIGSVLGIALGSPGVAQAHITAFSATGAYDSITVSVTPTHADDCKVFVDGAEKGVVNLALNTAGSKTFTGIAPGSHTVTLNCQHDPLAGSPPRPTPTATVQTPTAHNIDVAPFTGGLNVNIKDNTGTSGMCTYRADWYRSLPFSLAGGSTYDLKIVPSIAAGRNWNVTVSCDNGASTNVTKFY
jgi:hypothetical protein